jgi:hypothetical protein
MTLPKICIISNNGSHWIWEQQCSSIRFKTGAHAINVTVNAMIIMEKLLNDIQTCMPDAH